MELQQYDSEKNLDGKSLKELSVKPPKHGTVLLIYPNMVSEAYTPLTMIAAIMEDEGYSVTAMINTFRNPLDVDDYVKRVREKKIDIVGISSMTYKIIRTNTLVKALKDEGCYVMLGGPHPSDCPEEGIESGADVVVRGEGEETVRELCRYWNGDPDTSMAEIKGITYRTIDGVICTTFPRDRIKDLDTLPSPELDIFNEDIDIFTQPDGLVKGLHRVFTSRGCPAKCTFCDWTVFGQRMGYHSISAVVDEIKKRADRFGMDSFTINDDTFTVNRHRVEEFCELISKVEPKISWRCSTRASLVNLELLKMMKEAGCHLVTFGLESGDEETLLRTDKNISVEENYRAPIMAHEAGLQVYANLMIGFPWETVESIENNIKLIYETQDAVFLYQVSGSLVPFPGTGIYKKYADEYGFKDYWLREEYQEAGIQTFQNSTNPYAISTYYQRNLFDDAYIAEEVFFDYSNEFKRKAREFVFEVGKHNLKSLYPNEPLKRSFILGVSRVSSTVYSNFPRLEKSFGSKFFKLRNYKRPTKERRMDVARGFVLNKLGDDASKTGEFGLQ
tara:strand:+ start:10645 stop:12324 length:1680 start_codon:yes stop_codon:yes gene_type:complete